MPELIFITGCNAAGKSTFIRTRLNELEGFEFLMTDVYKSRTKELALKAIADRKDIVFTSIPVGRETCLFYPNLYWR